MLPARRDDLTSATMKGWTLSYLHSTGANVGFQIGNIVDPATPADKAREVIEQTLNYDFGPILHVSLGHKEHDKVITLQDKPNTHTVLNCDAVIFDRFWQIGIETMLGDCASIAVIGSDHVGFIHAGRPELFSGIVPRFMRDWPDARGDTAIFLSPSICGQHYELPDISAITGTPLEQFVCQTVWGTQGYDVASAIEWSFGYLGIDQMLRFDCEQTGFDCPFCAREAGHTQWASDQYCRVRQLDPLHPYSPRDCAFLHKG